MGKFRLLFVLCLAFLMSSCANKMALTKGQDSVVLSKKSLALLYVKMSNQRRPTYQPTILGARIIPPSATKNVVYDVKHVYKREKGKFNEYLLSFELEPGVNTLYSLYGMHNYSFFFTAVWSIDLSLKASINRNSVVYLGHIEAVVRDRKNDDEARAGSIFPLIDAAVVGFGDGSFDVVVEDKFDDDMKLFISEYPGLQKVEVDKSIFPQWIRPENRSTK